MTRLKRFDVLALCFLVVGVSLLTGAAVWADPGTGSSTCRSTCAHRLYWYNANTGWCNEAEQYDCLKCSGTNDRCDASPQNPSDCHIVSGVSVQWWVYTDENACNTPCDNISANGNTEAFQPTGDSVDGGTFSLWRCGDEG